MGPAAPPARLLLGLWLDRRVGHAQGAGRGGLGGVDARAVAAVEGAGVHLADHRLAVDAHRAGALHRFDLAGDGTALDAFAGAGVIPFAFGLGAFLQHVGGAAVEAHVLDDPHTVAQVVHHRVGDGHQAVAHRRLVDARGGAHRLEAAVLAGAEKFSHVAPAPASVVVPSGRSGLHVVA